jgi:hypothetical protein
MKAEGGTGCPGHNVNNKVDIIHAPARNGINSRSKSCVYYLSTAAIASLLLGVSLISTVVDK